MMLTKDVEVRTYRWRPRNGEWYVGLAYSRRLIMSNYVVPPQVIRRDHVFRAFGFSLQVSFYDRKAQADVKDRFLRQQRGEG